MHPNTTPGFADTGYSPPLVSSSFLLTLSSPTIPFIYTPSPHYLSLHTPTKLVCPSPPPCFCRKEESKVEEQASHENRTGMADGNTGHPSAPIRRRHSYRAPQSFLFPGPHPGTAAIFSCEPLWEDEPRHFLDACSLCRVPLRGPHDIYMYKGDTPFCSEECRQQQIELDEATEREASSRRGRWKSHRAAPSYVRQAASPVGGQRLRGPAADVTIAS